MNFLADKYEGMEHVWVPVGTKQASAANAPAGGKAVDGASTASGKADKSSVYEAVLKGNKNTILDEVKKVLAGGTKPEEIINGHLIPAINEVGELFDKQKYFLPQLISSANAMKVAIEYLEPMLARDDREPKATLVVATVEGDIHDIGKNLVVLMLKNYGYHVIDLGKEVRGGERRYGYEGGGEGHRTFRAYDNDDDAYEGCGRTGKGTRLYGEGGHRRRGDHGELCGGNRRGRLL